MAKFLLIFRESTDSRAKPSPEEMQALAAAWGTWMQKFSSAIVTGDGLKRSGRVLNTGLVTDGPYVGYRNTRALSRLRERYRRLRQL